MSTELVRIRLTNKELSYLILKLSYVNKYISCLCSDLEKDGDIKNELYAKSKYIKRLVGMYSSDLQTNSTVQIEGLTVKYIFQIRDILKDFDEVIRMNNAPSNKFSISSHDVSLDKSAVKALKKQSKMRYLVNEVMCAWNLFIWKIFG